jgi:NAD(P)-dependent dehydrogenase (short-subunit alcohol dehydrogenase family)
VTVRRVSSGSSNALLAGKVAIVTGAGRGIGRAIALAMVQAGARVVVCDIGVDLSGEGGDAGPAQTVVDEIKRARGEAIASTLSIAEPHNAEEIVKTAVSAFGRVDILVNNAGILRDRIFHRMSASDWSDVIAVHLTGSFSMSRACAPHFREQNAGAYVHMTSTSALVGNFGQANYMAAKFGIVGLARGIALDMQRFNVRSNCIAPFAWTRMIDSIPANTPEEKTRLERMQQMTPEKIAPLSVYLSSDSAAGISGQIFGVRNNEIFLFSQPRPIRTLHRSDGWTPEKLEVQLKQAFGPSFTPLERSSDVFAWDPV